MRKALVTGGGGFVGLALVKKLVAMGVETTVAGRNRYPDAELAGARCLVGDIRNREFVDRAVSGNDTVFHVAAKAGIWGDRKSYYTININGTENVISACLKNGVSRLVQTSTPSVVFNGEDIEGGDETLPYSEKPLCYYAATKIIAEQKVLAANSEKLKTAAIRPHLVWGPNDTQIIPRLLEQGMKGQLKIVGTGLNKVDISYIDNVADAHVLAAENLENVGTAAGEAFFISQGEPVVLWQWINDLFEQVGIPAVDSRISLSAAYRIGAVLEQIYKVLGLRKEPKMTRFVAEQLAKSHWFSIDKARLLLSYSPGVSNKSGMQELVRWLAEKKTQER